MRGAARTTVAAIVLAALSACEPPTSLVPQERPEGLVPEPAPEPAPPANAVVLSSDASQSLARFYARHQATQLSQGRLRTDAGEDKPFTAAMLAENFERIALYNEYDGEKGIFGGGDTQRPVHRWEKPVRMTVEFGASVSRSRRSTDLAFVEAYAAQLAAASGQSITLSETDPNFHIFVVNRDELSGIGPRLRAILPQISDQAVKAATQRVGLVKCFAYAFPAANGESTYQNVLVFIRSELPDEIRDACYHEEIGHGMGLGNDSPKAEPSIFNDDEEFARFTPHDALLLKILYDPRLEPGMTIEEARPIIATIAAELIGGPV